MTFDELFQYYANMGFGTQMVPQQTQEEHQQSAGCVGLFDGELWLCHPTGSDLYGSGGAAFGQAGRGARRPFCAACRLSVRPARFPGYASIVE